MDLDDFDETGVPIDEDDPFAESGVVPGLVVTSLVPATRVFSGYGGGMSTAAGRANAWLIRPAYEVMSQATEVLELLLLDRDLVLLRATYNASTYNGSRTVATLSYGTTCRTRDFITNLAALGDSRGLRLAVLTNEICATVEQADDFPERGGPDRALILCQVLSLALHNNANGWLLEDGVISDVESRTIERAAIALANVAQCKFAQLSALLHKAGETLEFAAFWERMEALTTGHEVAATFAPAGHVNYATTPISLVIMAAPTSEIGADRLPRKEIMASACVTSANEIRMHASVARVAVSDLHKFMDAVQGRHLGSDMRVLSSLGSLLHMLNLGNSFHFFGGLFGLLRAPRGGDSDESESDDDDDYWDTDWGTKFCFIVAPPGSEEFATLLDHRVGPYKLLHLLRPRSSGPKGTLVLDNIYNLVNGGDGLVVGDRSLLELLMSNPRGPPGWRMGPTYLS